MPEEHPPYPPPRPVVPIDPSEPTQPAPPVAPPPLPAMPVAEPGVMPPAPFAGVYSPPPPTAGPPPSMTMSPPPPPPGYYPPPIYPPPMQGAINYRNVGAAAGSQGRPGIVTAMAVTAIIVAVFSFVGSLFSGCTGLVTMTNARRAVAMRPPPAVTPMPGSGAMSPTPVGTQPASPNGLGAANRGVVIAVLKSRLRSYLTPEREQQIDDFLAHHGKSVLNDPADALTSKKVFDHLGEVGQEFSNPGTTPPAYFVFKPGTICTLPGRLRVMDDRWVYEPSDGSPTLRSPAAAKPDQSTATAAAPPPPPPLPDGVEEDEARAILNRVRALSNNRLNTAQSNTLSNLLQSPSAAAYLTPSGTIPGYTAQVRSAAVRSDGTIQITFNMGVLTLDAQGNTVGPMPTVATTGPAGATPGAFPNVFFTNISLSRGSCTVVMVDAGLGVLLAIFLLVIAILALRQTPGTRRLFVIYAVVKMLCSIAAIVALSTLLTSLSTGNTASPNVIPITLPWFTGLCTAAQVLTVIGLTFPVAVLLTLVLSKDAREYYRATG